MEDKPKTKRRRQFSLRSVLVMTAIVSIALGWWASRDRIPKGWELTAIYEAATIAHEDKPYLLTWCIEADERPLLVERCIVLSHRPDPDGGEHWHICELYR